MLYHEVFKQLESVRWNMQDDIPWHTFDGELLSDEQALTIKMNAITEWAALPATEMFLRDNANDSDFSAFMSIWFYEEQKHALTLIEYLKKFKPDLVIGTGGFASGPILFIASKFNIPTLIQEQNSYAGITNKILSKYADLICVAYDKMDRFFPKNKIIVAGNPVRKNIVMMQNNQHEINKLFNLNRELKTILIIGGSLGAKTINETIAKGLEKFRDNNLNIIWQTGESYSDLAAQLVKDLNVGGITTHTFIKKIELAYQAADIIVSRAGAIAISELCVVGKPVILVPSPNVAENHQYKNAQSLVNKNAAILVKDSDSNNKLVEEIIKLKSIEAFRELSKSPNSKVIVTDGKAPLLID